MSRINQAVRLWSRMNWALTAAILALAVIGVMFIYSASYARSEPSVQVLYQRQMAWFLAGLAGYFGMTLLDYRRLRDAAWWVYGLALVLLVAVLLVGTRIYGAKRWLMFFNTGLQPSELAKLAVILCVATLLGRRDIRADSRGVFWGIMALVAVPVALILKEPDLGTAMVLLPVLLIQLFVGGASIKPLIVILGLGFLTVALLLGALLLPERFGLPSEQQERILAMTGLTDYQLRRIQVFLDPDLDRTGAGWNRRQSEIAVGGGGPDGSGFLEGGQKKAGFLPPTVASTDFIFAVIAEETGFRGSVIVLILFAILLACGMQAAGVASDRMGRLLCVGVMAMIFSHVFVNVAMTFGRMPITGLPLPLVSYGGTFMVSTLVALGLVQSVYVRRPQPSDV